MRAAAVGGSVAACAAAVPPPRCRSLCCRLMASALFGMRAAPSRRNGGPRPSSALPLFRCRRPRLRSWRRQRGAKACAPAAGFRCAPRFWPRGGAILFSLRRVWGLRRLRAALKVYRAARAAQCKCGVHGFAMNLCDSLPVATAPYSVRRE